MSKWTSILAVTCCLLAWTTPVQSSGQSKLDRIVEGFRVEDLSVDQALKALRRAARLPLFHEDFEPPGTPKDRSRDWTGVLIETKVSVSVESGTVREVLDLLNEATPIRVIESECCINVVAEGVIQAGDPLGQQASEIQFVGEIGDLLSFLRYQLDLPFHSFVYRMKWEGQLKVKTAPAGTVRDLINEASLQKGVVWSMLLYSEPEEEKTFLMQVPDDVVPQFLVYGRSIGVLYFSGAFSTYTRD